MIKKGYIADGLSFLTDAHKLTKGQHHCGNCHSGADELHGQCPRSDVCIRNLGTGKTTTYLGVSVSEVPPAVRQHVKLPSNIGLMVESIEPDSPAAKADLHAYDILEKLDRQLLVNQDQFSVLIKMHRPDDELSVELIRANERKSLSVKLGQRVVEGIEGPLATTGERTLMQLAQERAIHLYSRDLTVHAEHDLRASLVTYLGVNTSPPSEALAEQLKLPKGLGLVIDSVEGDSPAAAAGLRPCDVLEKLDDQLLANSEQLTVLIRNHRAGDEVEITLIREGELSHVRAKLAQHQLGDAALVRATALAQVDLVNDDFRIETVEVTNDKLSKAVDLSVAGSDVKDEDFVRRIYLDLTGTPPVEEEVADFAADTARNKRQRLVERLLNRSDVIGKLSGNAVLQWSDNEHSLVLSTAETGQKHLLARDKNGTVVFDGRVDTDDQRNQLDPRLAAKLELMLRGLPAARSLEVPADAAAALEKTLPRFQADSATLDQLLDRLRRDTGVNIVVDRKALTAAGVKPDEPLSLDLHDVRARTVLKTVLALVGGAKTRLIYEVDDGVVLITTPAR